MNPKITSLVSSLVSSAIVMVNSEHVQAQTPGQIPMLGQPLTGSCNSANGNDCVDSVIAQDPSGNIGIGTTTPAAKLDVAGGNANLEDSTAVAGNILKGGALFLHNFGTGNTFIGKNAGNLTLDPSPSGARGNTSVGVSALSSLTSGISNSATGGSALRSNTTGFQNTATGAAALFSNTTGYSNTASGYAALDNNCSSVCAAGQGSYNTAVGFNALSENTTGSFNTALGAQADVCPSLSCVNLTNATAIGANAVVSQSNSLVLGNNANVGIGTSSPGSKLHIAANGGLMSIQGQDHAFVEWFPQGLAAGRKAWIGFGGPGTSHFSIFNEASAGHIILWPISGNVGIGTSAPGFRLDVAGAAHASSFPTSSDVRLKKNIEPLSNALEKLEEIHGVTFEWNEQYEALGRSTGRKEIGVIAQDVEAVFPELVTTWAEEGYRAVDYGRLTAVLIEAVKELHQQSGALRKKTSEIDELRAQLAEMVELRAQLSELRNLLDAVLAHPPGSKQQQ